MITIIAPDQSVCESRTTDIDVNQRHQIITSTSCVNCISSGEDVAGHNDGML